jgi:hypothetical protein
MATTPLKRVLAASAVTLAIVSLPVHAAPISIDFEFSPITVSFNGVVQSTGDISVSIETDTSTPNLGGSFGDFDNFYAADVYFTSSTLGLNRTRVSSPTELYFGASVVGFRIDDFSTIFTAYIGPQLSFGTAFDLSTITVPQGPISLEGTEFRTDQAITFANGSVFDAGAFTDFSGQQNTVRVRARDTNVPAPGALSLIALGLLAAVRLTHHRQRT